MLELYDRIRMRREELNLSQDELAQKLGYKSRSSINKIEKGINDIPQSKIKAFAIALETTPEYLMGWTDQKEPSAPDQELSDHDKNMVAAYNAAPEHIRKSVDTVLEPYSPVSRQDEDVYA